MSGGTLLSKHTLVTTERETAALIERVMMAQRRVLVNRPLPVIALLLIPSEIGAALDLDGF